MFNRVNFLTGNKASYNVDDPFKIIL